jgi:glycosyltransferase involved in cell wall biosynthesis
METQLSDAGPPLRILIIGGSGLSQETRGFRESPEVTLETGLLDRHHHVVTSQHNWKLIRREWDVVHVHHTAHQALIQAIRPSGSRLVFTRHQTTQNLSIKQKIALGLIYRRADGIVALSQIELKDISHSVAGSRVCCIPNGIDASYFPFERKTPPAAVGPWNLLFVGQLIPFKNVDVLFRSISNMVRSIDVRLRLVYQNAEMEGELRALANELGISNRVEYIGRVPRNELAHFHHWAHCLVLPSAHTEALPSVITEAMLSGVPVIASAVGGIPEQLNGFGMLVAPSDPQELSAAISAMFSNYGVAIQRAEMAYEYARGKYTVDAMVEGHLSLYRKLLAEPRRKLWN